MMLSRSDLAYVKLVLLSRGGTRAKRIAAEIDVPLCVEAPAKKKVVRKCPKPYQRLKIVE